MLALMKPLDFELRPELLLFDLEAATKADIFRVMIVRLRRYDRIQDTDAVLQRVIKRENIRGTGIARGVACPHARIDGLEGVELAVARLATPLDFGAADGVPARHIFLILTGREVDQSLHMLTLSAIVKCYQSPELLALMDRAIDAEEYLGLLQSCNDE